ncbi:MAG TPA: hypothetical protein VFF30_12765 [Nitrososphaerales archaeon]|nr:hypothetical protein [Nitrososphaerales archaeon]
MDTQHAVLVVSAEVIPGKDDEFNSWYDEHHIPSFSSKMPHLKSIRRYYSKKSNPQSIAIYEYSTMDELKISLASKESEDAGKDADAQLGKLVKSFTYNRYLQTHSTG